MKKLLLSIAIVLVANVAAAAVPIVPIPPAPSHVTGIPVEPPDQKVEPVADAQAQKSATYKPRRAVKAAKAGKQVKRSDVTKKSPAKSSGGKKVRPKKAYGEEPARRRVQ